MSYASQQLAAELTSSQISLGRSHTSFGMDDGMNTHAVCSSNTLPSLFGDLERLEGRETVEHVLRHILVGVGAGGRRRRNSCSRSGDELGLREPERSESSLSSVSRDDSRRGESRNESRCGKNLRGNSRRDSLENVSGNILTSDVRSVDEARESSEDLLGYIYVSIVGHLLVSCGMD